MIIGMGINAKIALIQVTRIIKYCNTIIENVYKIHLNNLTINYEIKL